MFKYFRVEIRGDPADSAVLVTDTLTFDLKEAETSNSLLLLPDLSMGPDLPESAENQIINRQVRQRSVCLNVMK